MSPGLVSIAPFVNTQLLCSFWTSCIIRCKVCGRRIGLAFQHLPQPSYICTLRAFERFNISSSYIFWLIVHSATFVQMPQ